MCDFCTIFNQHLTNQRKQGRVHFDFIQFHAQKLLTLDQNLDEFYFIRILK